MVQLAPQPQTEREARASLTLVKPSAPGGARDVLVGGSNSAFPLPVNICVDRAEGSRIWDVDRREYLDFVLASGPLILGHAHPAVCDAVARQIRRGSAYHALNRPALDLATRLVEMGGCAELVRFASTGTEATMHAIRLARGFTGREKVMVFAGSYHGSHDVSIVGFRGAVAAARGGVPSATAQTTVVARFNDLSSVEEAFARYGDSLAGVIVEPQQRSVDPTAEFLPGLRRLCSAHGAVLIFDEVLTGFRLAFGGAREYYGVEPDIVCYGKILGGGFPLSAVCGRREIMELADPAGARAPDFVHISGTLSGNPVSAAAGLATLAELEAPGVYDRLHDLGRRLRDALAQQMTAHGVEGSVLGSGPIAAVEFGDAAGPGSGCAMKTAVTREMIHRGVLVQLATRFYVSLAHREDEIDLAGEVFGKALTATVQSSGV